MDKSTDLLSGALLPRIICFAVPLIAMGVLKLLFNTADTIVVGRWGGSTPEECATAMAAVGSCASLIGLIVNFFFGLSVGAGVCAAQSIGAKRYDEVEQVVHTSMLAAVLMGTVLAVAGMVLARPMLTWMGTDPAVLDEAVPYMCAYFAGTPAHMLSNFGASVLRSKGDTTRPLIFLAVGGVVNVALNLVMVLVFHMGALGVGIATAASHVVTGLMTVWHMMRLEDPCRMELKKLKIDRPALWRMMYIGIPAGIQATVFSFSNVMIQSSVNSFGKITVAANTAANNLSDYTYMVQNAFYHVALTFVGQAVGAKRYDRIRSIVLACIASVIVAGGGFGLMSYVFGEPLLGLFAPGNEEVIRQGMIRMKYMCLPYFLCGIMEVGSGLLRGMGRSMTSMAVAILGVCGIRLVWIFTVFAYFRTLEVLYLSYMVTWVITATTHFTFGLLAVRKLKRQATTDPIDVVKDV